MITRSVFDLPPNEVKNIQIQMRQSEGGGKFAADYLFGGKKGRFEASIIEDYWLRVEFTGDVATTCWGEPVKVEGGDAQIAQMSQAEKLNAAARLSLDKMPADLAAEVAGLLSPQSFALMIGMFGAAMAAELYGGPLALVIDLVLLSAGLYLLGSQAKEAGENIIEFYSSASNAQTDEDMDKAAEAFAKVVTMIGVNAVAAILFGKVDRKAKKAFKDRFVKAGTPPRKLGEIAAPKTPGRLFWDPNSVQVDFTANLPEGVAGSTTARGQIRVNRNLATPGEFVEAPPGTLTVNGRPRLNEAQLRTWSHERSHQFITCLASLSQLTFEMRNWAYERSYLFRYLEETLAEFLAGRRPGEPRLSSFRFAIQNGYIECCDLAGSLAEARESFGEIESAKQQARVVDKRLARAESYGGENRNGPTGGASRFFNESNINNLRERRATLEANRNPLAEVFDNLIRIPDGEGGFARLRFKAYADGSPFLAETGQLLGSLTVAGKVYRIFAHLGKRLPQDSVLRKEIF